MADNDNRNPWLDWGEPVEQTGKSWDEWGEPVEQTGKSWDEWGEPVEQTGKSWDEWGEPVPERTPTPSAPVPTPVPSSEPQSPKATITYKEPVKVNVVEEYTDENGTKIRTVRTVEDRTHTTTVPIRSGEGTGSENSQATSYSGGSPSSNVPKTITQTYTDEEGERRTITVPNPNYNNGGSPTIPNPNYNNGGSPTIPNPNYNNGGSPTIPNPNYNNGGSPTIENPNYNNGGSPTIPNPNYNNGGSPTIPNPNYNSGGVPIQSGVGNVTISAGGGSPTVTGGGSGSAANTTWGTEVIQQYPDDIPNHGSGNPDNIPKTIRQPYKDENGDIQYRTVPNPAYYAGQSGSGSGGSGSGSGGSIPFAGGGSGFGNNKKTEYYPDYAAAHKAIKGANYRYSAEGIRNEVESLQSYYNDVMNSMDGWTGMAKDSYQNATNSIKGKLTVIMNNINDSLIPASEAAEDLDELLTRLEDEDKNLHLLLEELNKREVEYQGALTLYNREPSTITETTTNPTTGEKETKSVANPKKETLRLEMNSAKEMLDMVQEEVEAQQQLEAELCEEIDEKIELIRTLQANIETMNSYVNPFGSNYHNISSHENINNNYDDRINDLTLPGPSVPNQSDYHDGDTVAFDDSYGEVITITQGHGNGGTGGGSMPIATEGPSISNDVTPAYDYPRITDAPTPLVEPPTSK